ncbi:PhzF family phenazine biosynthesis protein [Modestobacter versicolor]|uniref:Phenazine biosynthesis protein PhzF n=1 Tax=Modestobacter versicolor TaxID=429133 RepID=A0A323V6M4_9ACTN|nr:PhzF family phenazine biosynthesis isomerase [Modestobacter versicolor]MBB3675065.1 PhzF family phenazine biosynthesis protein [Modestobacter versicolor]PZA20479.1 phenazine biosynthesis protein PhzF [Modestobacter versicolor]
MSSPVLRYAAFTDGGRGGNPAGVVLDATGLTEAAMLATAAAVGYSETAFLVPGAAPGQHTVRYFSPLAEVAFCGHATVAAAVALAERDGPGRLLLATAAGPVEVTTASGPDGTTATLTSVPATSRPATAAQLDATLAALGWAHADLDPRFPAAVASAGNDHLVLGVRTRARLRDLHYDFPALQQLMAAEGWTTVHLFVADDPATFSARDPFPPGGVVEDAATGAAAAAFGGYLRDLGRAPATGRLTVLQGADMGSPSRLLVELVPGSARVRVTGAATRLPALAPVTRHAAAGR